MNSYDANRMPNPKAWLRLAEDTKIELVAAYHRRQHPQTPRVRLHATFHTIVENQIATKEPAVVDTLERLQSEGLSRHDTIHAIGSVLAAQVYDLLKNEQPDASKDPYDAYATELRSLSAEKWRRTG